MDRKKPNTLSPQNKIVIVLTLILENDEIWLSYKLSSHLKIIVSNLSFVKILNDEK